MAGNARWTRTGPEWVGGIIRAGVAGAVVAGAFAGIAYLVVNNISKRFGYHVHIGLGVPIGCAVGVGCVAALAFGWFMRPKRVRSRIGDGDFTAARGGHIWTGGSDPSALDAGRHRSTDVT